MTHLFRRRTLVTALALAASLMSGCATTEPAQPWPLTTVGIDRMRPLQRIQTSLLVHRMNNSPAATVVLRLHVDQAGDVVRAAVHESSGYPKVDGAALGGMRKMKFAPYLDNGIATAVTVIVPLHFPAIS